MKNNVYPLARRGGHRHLQIGRMLDIDLISEPPRPPPHRCIYPKCGNLCGQRVRKRFMASWGLRMSHICPCTPCPSPQGYRSKVESRHFAHHPDLQRPKWKPKKKPIKKLYFFIAKCSLLRTGCFPWILNVFYS
jgi:hypothetical protein